MPLVTGKVIRDKLVSGISLTEVPGVWQHSSGALVVGTYALPAHNHDDRYYTESEINSLLTILDAAKSNVGHTHDDRYFTEAEVSTLLAGKSNTGHTHAWADIVSGIPTTLAGYGITDAVPNTRTVNGLALSNNISLTTDNVSEGTVNKYFTDERVDDRVAALLVAGSNITLDYNDVANTLTINASVTGGGGGTVTSVNASVPTGLTVSGVPITTSGTIAIGLDTGYVIPTQAALDALQPLDADLTAIAALTTTSFGRSLLTQTDAAATRTTIGSAATSHTHAAADTTSGVFSTARLGTGSGDNSVFLRGDGAWSSIIVGPLQVNALTATTGNFSDAVDVAGTLRLTGTARQFQIGTQAGSSSVVINNSQGFLMYDGSGYRMILEQNGWASSGGIHLGNAYCLFWSSTTAADGTKDLKLIRHTAGALGIYGDGGLYVRNYVNSAYAPIYASSVVCVGTNNVTLAADAFTSYGGVTAPSGKKVGIAANGSATAHLEVDTAGKSTVNGDFAVAGSGRFFAGVVTYSTLTGLTASVYTGAILLVSDRNYRAAYSDGTDWRWLENGAKVAETPKTTLTIRIDGAGSAITTGAKKLYRRIPFACTIESWELVADASGSIVIDLWVDTYANFPPTVADTITGSAKPTLSSQQKANSSTLTGWTKAIPQGSYLELNVDSASTVTVATLTIVLRKT